MYNILICDDEKDIINALKIYLKRDDYQFFQAENGLQALEIIEKEEIHLVLMDIMMPVMDGITAMVKIRESSNVPVILLTAKSEDTDKILGLNVGADDYITKPFNPVEVMARVQSQLRRYMRLGGKAAGMSGFEASNQSNDSNWTGGSGSVSQNGACQENEDGPIIIGGIELYDSEKRVTVDGEDVTLTPTEYGILKLLMENPGKVYSPSRIYNLVWKDNSFGSENTVSVHVRHLREKIEINPAEPRYLKVVWGQGYKMEKDNGKR